MYIHHCVSLSFLCSVVPNITFPPDGQLYTVNETDPVTFTCSATGIPPPEITWIRSGVVLDESVDSRISLSDPSDPETVSTAGGNIFSVSRNLTLDNTRDNDSDTYTCVASNAAANVTQDFDLVVQGEKIAACVYIHIGQKVDVREGGGGILAQHRPLNLLPLVKLLLLFPQLLHESLIHQMTSQLLSLKMPLSPAWPLADQDLTLCGLHSQTWPSYRTSQESS